MVKRHTLAPSFFTRGLARIIRDIRRALRVRHQEQRQRGFFGAGESAVGMITDDVQATDPGVRPSDQRRASAPSDGWPCYRPMWAGVVQKKEGAHRPGAAAPDVCNGPPIPTKVPVKKPHRKPLKNHLNYAPSRWLFGPENAISVKF